MDGFEEMFLENLSPVDKAFLQNIHSRETPVLYGAVLACQTRLYSEKILEPLRNLPFWPNIHTILDIGCGPGEVAKHLSQYFALKNKKYFGIDIEKSFIDQAVNKNLASNINFVDMDLFDLVKSDFDVVLAITVLQHLGNIDKALAKISSLVNKNGYILLFDTIPEIPLTFEPDVPAITEIFESISQQKSEGKRNDNCLFEARVKAKRFNLREIEMDILKIEISEASKEECVRFALLMSELVKRFYSLQIDQDKLWQQLICWLNQNGTTELRVGKLILQKLDRDFS